MTLKSDLDAIVKSQSFIPKYVEAISFLQASGLLSYIRNLGNSGLKSITTETAAIKGAHAAGWHDCLDVLENFTDTVLLPLQNAVKEAPRPDFGSLNKAYEQGDIDLEEQEALRNGKQPDYSKYIGTASAGTKGN